MAALAILVLGFMVFIFQKIVTFPLKEEKNRKGITGFEISRFTLDGLGFPDIAIEMNSEKIMKDRRQVVLDPEIYKGKTFSMITEAVYQTLLQTQTHLPFTKFLQVSQRFLSLLLWILIAIGLFHAGSFFLSLAGVLAGGLILMALPTLQADSERGREGFRFMQKSTYFDVDELIKLKTLIKSKRLDVLSDIAVGPFRMFVRGA